MNRPTTTIDDIMHPAAVRADKIAVLDRQIQFLDHALAALSKEAGLPADKGPKCRFAGKDYYSFRAAAQAARDAGMNVSEIEWLRDHGDCR
jgi:hypothetical protein